MSNQCVTCSKQKANLECGICHVNSCKSCAQFISQDQFSFLPQIPSELSHTVYCQNCFITYVEPEMQKYEETMAQARDLIVFEKNQGKETRFIKRIEKPIQVKDCADHDEVMLRLAFVAVRLNYNAIIDVDIKSKKLLMDGTYKTTVFSGTGVPANVESHKLMKDRAIWQNPN